MAGMFSARGQACAPARTLTLIVVRRLSLEAM
jgi:hypothetical protein